ncbi:DUF1365 domain-containing protein [Pseudomarimonas salicorniae]|uniref:DUF1365 domain-containing protein n=1 Tax=Pseudomarimonas salicorniae TaxID=2933270 RepID=A0ABT0GH34_9GAMM|nr:DUF1365 domain-containing protein [Lysobacter sp. CAU 1642]MCK7593854.1 DUF1365 domain-containing protein [Lysobacter sp. CAU 1642]
MSAGLASAIYRGEVQHRRHSPHPHAFRYPLFMLYLDLDELPGLFAGRWLWSINRRNLAEFRRSDYLGDADRPLKACVLDTVAAATGQRPDGPVRLLTHLRYFGHCFNPVSFYYCFEACGERLHSIVAEITNTPWKERHRYVLPLRGAESLGEGWRWDFRKAFHVSPFLPLDRDYRWRFGAPGEQLRVHMDSRSREGKDFDATLSLRREPITAGNLARCLLRHPAMTLRVVLAIHWQALLIWCKRNPVYDHPSINEAHRRE